MADKDIIQNMISRLGQCQDERMPEQLGGHFVEVDERTATDLLAEARALAGKLRFYQDTPEVSSGDWRAFFPDGDDAALLARADGQTPPHLALFAAFAHLYQHPQQAINRITERHRDFQFQDVLRFQPKPACPDRAFLLLELKKGTAPLMVTPEMAFTAGKDASGVELLYKPVRKSLAGQGKVMALHSVYRDARDVYYAPLADSSDGQGNTPATAKTGWRAFGGPAALPDHPQLPRAPVGCAFSSPVLRMQEGNRTIRIELHLSGSGSNKAASALSAWLTGPKGWLGPFVLADELTGNQLTLSTTIPVGEAAVVDYDASLHGHAFDAQAPVLQLLLDTDATTHYADLEPLALVQARITVAVDATQALTLENDYGSLNPKKAFQPFGAQPVKGSRLLVGCEEALAKHLLGLEIRLDWQGAPDDLYGWYENYSRRSRLLNGVHASLSWRDRSGSAGSAGFDLMARGKDGCTLLKPGAPELKPDHRTAAEAPFGRHPAKRALPAAPATGGGFVTVTLLEDFLHADYRKETLANALAQNKKVLNEPYTPMVQSISLGYRAQSAQENFSAGAGHASAELRFFHVGPFGERREHPSLRRAHAGDPRVTLLPGFPDEGELLIGLAGVAAGDGVSLLVQVSEDSADPDLPPAQPVWSVLAGEYWRTLTAQEIALDTTNQLRASGIVSIALPQQTTTQHGWMPAGLVWLRAAVQKNSAAACKLLCVAANAVEVAFAPNQLDQRGNDPAHLAAPLQAGSIAKFKAAQPGVKSVTQPYASFGGSRQESADMLTRRAAERLRHRARCITPWDFERMLLDAFPGVHKVKCIPHASADSWMTPGHVLLVAIPDLRNRNGVNLQKPRVDVDTLARMENYAQRHAGSQVKVKVRSPDYQAVRLDFKVRFMPGCSFNHHRQLLEDALIAALTPWAFDRTREIEFGGRIYRSVLLDLVEELPFVDFVTDFRMRLASDAPGQDAAEISAAAPDCILVSDATHTIAEITAA